MSRPHRARVLSQWDTRPPTVPEIPLSSADFWYVREPWAAISVALGRGDGPGRRRGHPELLPQPRTSAGRRRPIRCSHPADPKREWPPATSIPTGSELNYS
jgi:hypothetical protein